MPGLMPVRCEIEGDSYPGALSQVMTKMAQLGPGCDWNVGAVSVAPGGSPPRRVGPPWVFSFQILFTTP